jgi:hypothetical protein
VTVDELILGVNIALGESALDNCPTFDANSSNDVTVDELVSGVNNALVGCEPPALPDLVPASVMIAPPPAAGCVPDLSEVPRIEVCVQNQGTAAAGPFVVLVDALTGGENVTMAVTGLDADTQTCFQTDFIESGSVFVDVADDVQELDEENNSLDFDLPVPTPPVTCTPTEVEAPTPTPTATMEEATSTPTGMGGTPTPTETGGATPTATEVVTASPTASEGTATPTPTPPAEATPTATEAPTQPSQDAAEVFSGRAGVIVNTVGGINSVVSAIVVAATGGGASLTTSSQLIPRGADIDSCPLGGSTTQDCDQSFLTITLTLGADDCMVPSPAGGTAAFNGMIRLVGQGICPLPLSASYTVDLGVVLTGEAGITIITANLDGNLSLQIDPGESCLVDGLSGTINDTISIRFPNGATSSVTFTDTQFNFTDVTFDDDCVPLAYTIVLNGAASFDVRGAALIARGAVQDESFMVSFDNFTLRQDATMNPVAVTFGGMMTSHCFGGEIALQTLAPIAIASGQLCPRAGTLEVTQGASTSTVVYGSDGSVTIDGQAFPTCLDPELLMCVEDQ